MNTQDTRSIEDIIRMIDDGKLVLPEFQRDFKWPIEKSEILFDSIFQDLFIGSLIISKPKFELACKSLDLRERGSKKHKPKPIHYSVSDFENKDVYTLLDGQQRTTSIYRSLKGYDRIYIIFKNFDFLFSSDNYDYESNDVIIKYSDYIEGFDSQIPKDDTLYICLSDLYTNMDSRETKFTEDIVLPIISDFKITPSEKEVLNHYACSLRSDFKSDIIKKSNLLSVQLLNMNLEKFCLYFERSNSQGLNLSFTDIIIAKVYLTFNLSKHIREAKEKYKYFDDNLVDIIVRYINFVANNEVTKKSILSDLRGEHFDKYWDTAIEDLSFIQNWLEDNHWVMDVSKIPYRTMLLPILSFYQNLPNKDFSQASKVQIDLLKFWFFGSIYDNRYGGARHGSTNVVLKKDCETLKDLANNIYPELNYWQNIRIEYSFDEYLKIDGNSNAKFMSINYLMWLQNKFRNLENDAAVSIKSNIEVHHLFPSAYIKSKYGDESNEFDLSDCVLNKVRINKISNIKIGSKSPNKYLNEISEKNKNLKKSLESHFVSQYSKLIDDKNEYKYTDFLKDRYNDFLPILDKLALVRKRIVNNDLDDIWK